MSLPTGPDTSAYRAPIDSRPNDAGGLQQHQRLALVAGGLALVLQGVFAATGNQPGALLALVATASAATMWCIVDSMNRQRYWHRSAQIYTFALWPIAVPVYLIWSRGKRGVWMGVGYLAATVVLPLLGGIIGAVLL